MRTQPDTGAVPIVCAHRCGGSQRNSNQFRRALVLSCAAVRLTSGRTLPASSVRRKFSTIPFVNSPILLGPSTVPPSQAGVSDLAACLLAPRQAVRSLSISVRAAGKGSIKQVKGSFRSRFLAFQDSEENENVFGNSVQEIGKNVQGVSHV